MLDSILMKSSSQKTGFSIAVMIGVIITAGVSVDWWDAHQSRKLGKPVETVETDDVGMKRLAEDNERLKTDNALLNIQNDALRKQVEELSQKQIDLPKVDVVKGEKPPED